MRAFAKSRHFGYARRIMPQSLVIKSISIAALLALASACGSELTGDPASGERLDSALELLRDPWCKPFAARFCAAASTCGCTDAGGWPDDCESATERSCMLDLQHQADALPDGFLVSTDTMPRCLALLDESLARCAMPEPDTFPTECSLVVPLGGVGFLRAGDVCGQGPLCGRGLRCSSIGRCRPPLGAGEHCVANGDCQSGLECGFGQVCHIPEPHGLGEFCDNITTGCSAGSVCGISQRLECRGDDDGHLCRFSAECSPNELCGGDGHCTARAKLGEPCSFGFFCAPNLACDIQTFICRELPESGEQCGVDETGNGTCAHGLACHGGVCGPPFERGAPCTFGLDECAGDLVCTFDTSGSAVCGAASQQGEPCQSDPSCARGLLCDFGTFTCQPALGEGERCASTVRCAVPFECVAQIPGDFRCARIDSVGDACNGSCPVPLQCLPVETAGACVAPMCMSLAF